MEWRDASSTHRPEGFVSNTAGEGDAVPLGVTSLHNEKVSVSRMGAADTVVCGEISQSIACPQVA